MTNENGGLPLDGIRVCDFTWIVAGPQATRILADMGADVIEVENEGIADALRAVPGLHSNFHRNKRSINVNIHHPDGREVVDRLIRCSDIVIENFSTGTLARMGYPYERIQELNPDAIYISLSGYGQLGRDAMYGTWGPTAQGASGLTAMSRLPGQPPAGWGYSYLDHTGGFYGAIAALMALWHRSQTGEAQHIDMSQVETGMVLAGLPMIDAQVNGRSYEAIGNRSRWPAVAPHGIYRCAGDYRWIAIAAEDDAQWAALCEVLVLDAADARFATTEARLDAQDELDAAIEAVTRGRTAEEVAAQLVERGVPAGVCQTAEDRLEHDPQLADRGFYPRADHPSLGEHRFEGLPMYFDGERPGVRAAGPDLGGDRDNVLRDLLGFTDDEIARMLSEAAI